MLLISGQPGAGKSSFCRWLANQHGYVHVETDVEWAQWGPYLGASDLASARDARNQIRLLGPDVAFEWGFSPELLPRVKQLAMMGLERWWFRADELAYQAQIARIEGNWSRIEAVYRDRILDVLDADGLRATNDEIYSHIAGHLDP